MQNEQETLQSYDLTCWYLNLRRLTEILGESLMEQSVMDSRDEYHRHTALLARAKNELLEVLLQKPPATLASLVLTDQVKVGKLFTHLGTYYCKGLQTYLKAPTSAPPPEVYAKLGTFGSNFNLVVPYYPEHLTSNSARAELSGQRTLFVLGVIKEVGHDRIFAIPYVIASLILDAFGDRKGRLKWPLVFEVTIDEIDSFEEVRREGRPRERDLSLLRQIPESAIKGAFASVLGDETLPKDWGGERSDLVSTRVVLNGARIPTAFAFKGPSKFFPLTLASLGKNGDQIDRLFTEPADLLVLQHCHIITPPVRGAMRAYAQNIGHPRLCCSIDGLDTLRFLRAYRPELLSIS